MGNQLFQYSMARRLALRHGTDVLLDSSGYKPLTSFDGLSAIGHRQLGLFDFRIVAREATEAEKSLLRDRYVTRATTHRAVRFARRYFPGLFWPASHIVEKGHRFDPGILELPDYVYLSGFWQSEKYFIDEAQQIRQDLVLRDESITEEVDGRVQALRHEFGSVISLHVRRGDLAYAYENQLKEHNVVGPPMHSQYFEEAMSRFPASACYLVFSDTSKDIEWCRQNIRATHIEFSHAESTLWDFAAMQACDHNILSNSTFSWWAAWLNPNPGRQVVAPRRWSGPAAKIEIPTDDLMPADWTLI
ncbi:MAG: hypothetical protein QOF24_431 [Verrucomicrobiota bacterium]